MKKLIIAAFFGSLIFTSCAQKEENREEYKEERNVEEKRNAGVDSALLQNDPSASDSLTVE